MEEDQLFLPGRLNTVDRPAPNLRRRRRPAPFQKVLFASEFCREMITRLDDRPGIGVEPLIAFQDSVRDVSDGYSLADSPD